MASRSNIQRISSVHLAQFFIFTQLPCLSVIAPVREFCLAAWLRGARLFAYFGQQPHPAVVIGVTELRNHTVFLLQTSEEAWRAHVLNASRLHRFSCIKAIEKQTACQDREETDDYNSHLSLAKRAIGSYLRFIPSLYRHSIFSKEELPIPFTCWLSRVYP